MDKDNLLINLLNIISVDKIIDIELDKISHEREDPFKHACTSFKLRDNNIEFSHLTTFIKEGKSYASYLERSIPIDNILTIKINGLTIYSKD